MTIQELTDKTFESLTDDKKGRLLVLFYATSCPHCKAAKPGWGAFVKRQPAGGVVFGQVNVDKQVEAADAADITSMPTFLAIKAGAVVDQHRGPASDADLERMLGRLMR